MHGTDLSDILVVELVGMKQMSHALHTPEEIPTLLAGVVILCVICSCAGTAAHDDGNNHNHSAAVCGNGVLEAGEQCDGSDLAGHTCETQGFEGGLVRCTQGCLLDTRDCHLCGDGVVSGPEACDGSDLAGATCGSLGFVAGALACSVADCDFDTSQCTMCGNGLIDLSQGEQELCDGPDLGGQTCFLETGLPDGELVCDPSCESFDTSGCHDCGNGVREGPEDCDGASLGPATCLTETGHTEGALSCNGDCTFDVSTCHTCGDGVRDGPELCDGLWVGLETCQSQAGVPDGVLTCLPGCAGYDLSGCHTCGNGILEGPEDCEDGNTTDWDGCTDCFINEIQANTYTLLIQQAPALAASDSGSFVIVWQSTPSTPIGQDGDESGVFGQRFDATGLPVGPEFQVNTYIIDHQWRASVAMAADGRFVVVWQSWGQDGDEYGVFGQRFDALGLPVGGEFPVNTYTTSAQTRASVAMAADGSFVVVWHSLGQDTFGYGVYARRFDSEGTALGPELLVNSYVWDWQNAPHVAMTADGRFVVVWQSQGQDGFGCGIFGQRYDSAGFPAGGEFRINTHTEDSQRHPSVAITDDGSFVVAWDSAGQDLDGSTGVIAQRFDALGSPVGGEILVNTYTPDTQREPSVSMAPDGSFIVVWESYDQFEYGVFGQRFDSTGAFAGSEFQVNYYQPHFQWNQVVTMVANGRFIVSWDSAGQDGSGSGIFFQRYDSSGNPLGTTP